MMGQTMMVKRTLLLLTAMVAALAACLLALGTMAKPAEAAFPGNNGKIAFERNGEVYTMYPDGSDPTNLTSSPKSEDLQPDWRPLP